MADKKVSPSTKNEATQTSNSELETLRSIVFGAAKSEIDERISQLEQAMLNSFAEAEKNLNKQVEKIQASLSQGIQTLEHQISSVDQQHDEKSGELKDYADKLASELEMTDASGKQDSDELHSRLDKEVQALTQKYDAKFAEALEKLNQVTQELGSTKTDRKTLAKLLATVASNLETDQE